MNLKTQSRKALSNETACHRELFLNESLKINSVISALFDYKHYVIKYNFKCISRKVYFHSNLIEKNT